jgi:hypothetical protein
MPLGVDLAQESPSLHPLFFTLGKVYHGDNQQRKSIRIFRGTGAIMEYDGGLDQALCRADPKWFENPEPDEDDAERYPQCRRSPVGHPMGNGQVQLGDTLG